MLFTETSGRFNPGRLIATQEVLKYVPREEVLNAYVRHLNCDWGEVPGPAKASNEAALQYGGQLLSAYRSKAGIRFLIITSADRSATTCLMPSDY